MVRLSFKFFILGVLIIFGQQQLVYAENNRTIRKRVATLLDKAEKYSATQSRSALLYADSALLLSRTLNEPELDMAALKIIVLTDLYIGDYNQCIDAAGQLLKTAQVNNNDTYRMYSHIGLGQANIMKNNFQEAKINLDSAFVLGNRLGDDFALCSVYNGLGIYHTNADANYYRSIEYYLQGIAAAERSSNERLHSVLLCNLSGVYSLKKDVAGLPYALQCYQRGHQLNQSFLIFIGAVNTAYCLFLEKKYDEALRYLREAEQLMIERRYLNQANLYVLFGHINFDMGKMEEAIAYYEKALNESDQTKTSYLVEAYLGLAKIAVRTKKYPQAFQYLKKGIDLATFNKDNALDRRDLYYELSKCYEETGNYSEALRAFKLFTDEHNHIFDQDKEYHLSELMIKYEAEQTKRLLKERDLALFKKEKRLHLLYIAIFIALAVSVVLVIMIRRRNKRYMDIVRQNLYLLEKQKTLKSRYEVLQTPDEVSPDSVGEKYATSALSEEKSADLYLELQKLMMENKLYKDSSLTKDRLADMLNTNRSYLSQVINQHTGLPYNHYINRLRIEEVLPVLSDPNDDTPLKAIAIDTGFNTLATFYSAFQSVVGMPPSAYRSKMREIFRQKNNKTE